MHMDFQFIQFKKWGINREPGLHSFYSDRIRIALLLWKACGDTVIYIECPIATLEALKADDPINCMTVHLSECMAYVLHIFTVNDIYRRYSNTASP